MRDYMENLAELRGLAASNFLEESPISHPITLARDNPKLILIKENTLSKLSKEKTGEKNLPDDINIHAKLEYILFEGLGGHRNNARTPENLHLNIANNTNHQQIHNQTKSLPHYIPLDPDRPRPTRYTVALAIKFGNKLSWVQKKRALIPTIMKAGIGKELYIYFLKMGRICKALRSSMNSLDRLIGLRMQYTSTPKTIKLHLADIFSYTIILGKTMNVIVKRLRLMRHLDAAIVLSASKVTAREVFRKDEMEQIKASPELKPFSSIGTLSPLHVRFSPQVMFDLSVGQKSFKTGLSWLIYGTKVLRGVLKEIKAAARLLKKMGTAEEDKDKDKDNNKNHKYAAQEVLDNYNESKGQTTGYGGDEEGEGPASGGEDWRKPTKMADKDVSFGTKGAFTEGDRRISRKMTKKIMMDTRFIGQFFKELDTGQDTKTLHNFGIKMGDNATLSMFNSEQNEIESAVGSMLTHDI